MNPIRYRLVFGFRHHSPPLRRRFVKHINRFAVVFQHEIEDSFQREPRLGVAFQLDPRRISASVKVEMPISPRCVANHSLTGLPGRK
jgi:hypothetical protein